MRTVIGVISILRRPMARDYFKIEFKNRMRLRRMSVSSAPREATRFGKS